MTNTATDIDVPAQGLSYQLLNPPAGAVIDGNGVMNWTPTELQGPSTNTLITVVTDDGSPSLSATNSFQVVVEEVNAAPTFVATPGAQALTVGTPWSVTNAASDADLPINILSYQLLDPPGGMTIDGNGVISSDPDGSQFCNHQLGDHSCY